jgi:radical SAM protein with 4Fe4S-binding SPASM domain
MPAIFRKRIGFAAWRFARKILDWQHRLNSLYWEATLRCNLQCRHCIYECSSRSKYPEISAGEVISFFRNVADNFNPNDYTVGITGGEPLIREDLFEVVTELNRLGFKWSLATNGMLISDPVVEKLVRHKVAAVMVSLDGPAEVHNGLRENKESFSRAVQAIKRLRLAKDVNTIHVMSTITPYTVAVLPELYSILKELKIDSWSPCAVIPKGRAMKYHDLLLNGIQLRTVFNFLKQLRSTEKSITVEWPCEAYLGLEWEGEVRSHFSHCRAGTRMAGLLCDGSYSICPTVSRDWIQGHINEITFTDAWKTRYRKLSKRTFTPAAFCRNCNEVKNCSGSARHLLNAHTLQPERCYCDLLKKSAPSK